MQYLEECLDSIVNQTYPHLEILLIDDGSTDDSGKIADLYASRDSRVKVFHKPNGGVCSARNFGVDHATGDYIAFIDSDDTVHEDYLEALLDHAIKYDADICFCISHIIGRPLNRPQQPNHHLMTSQEAIVHLLQADLFGCALNKLYKAELHENLRAPEDIAINEDILMNFFLFQKAKKILFFDDKLYNYRHREGSASRSGFNRKQLDMIKVTRTIFENISDEKSKAVAEKRYLHALSACHKGTLVAQGFEQEQTEIEKSLRGSAAGIVLQPHLGLGQKCEYLAQGFLPMVYKVIFDLRRKR
jgi:glycosyltransferase involved in cell wall biosynthesis